MQFGPRPVESAAGCVLVHALALPGGAVLKKGRVLSAADIAAIRAAGIETVVAAALDADEVGENVAAARLAVALAGAGVRASPAATGRVNLFATAAGVLALDPAAIDAANGLDEALTIATLPRWSVVTAGQMLATVKIIPYAVAEAALGAAMRALGPAPMAVAPFPPPEAPWPVALIHTALPQSRPELFAKMRAVTEARLAPLGARIVDERICPHDAPALAAALAALPVCRLILIAGASAIADRRDVIPAAIRAAGGRVDQFGMPVDPGNLILLGELGSARVIGLPGCARSPKFNGVDLVLPRLLAGLQVAAADMRGLGVGGLLADVPRPLPRAALTLPPAPPPAATPGPILAGLLLAAGQGTRMGGAKMLRPLAGRPLVRHAAAALAEAGFSPRLVVTGGLDGAAIIAALDGLDFAVAVNPAPQDGLAGSLRVGLEALPAGIDGVLIALGDMPRVTPETLRRLAAAFDPAAGRAICVPVQAGQRGNPILWAATLIPEMRGLAGDQGARGLLARHVDLVHPVPVDDPGVLIDVDTPEALAALERNDCRQKV